ncbi:MAG: Na+/H+ antiporter subunit E [Gammaproteobacteria bacterium]
MTHAFSLGLVLYALWCVLSGYLQPMLLGLGLISCAFVVLIALRMDLVDREWRPIHLLFGRVLGYWPWLMSQIFWSNVDVVRRILDPRLPISPTLIWVKASQHTDIGRVTYANSITVTPGTLAMKLQGDEILVHALSREGAEALAAGEMDRRVTLLEKHS